ncbi:8805_t:CDS:2, partial [Ambispora leptoticha]
YRKLERDNSHVYYSPLNQQTNEAFEDLFNRLTQGRAVKQQSLEFLGRSLNIPMACGDIARFSFAELCGRPLSAADYLELTRHYRVIVVSGIPRMSLALKNEARRFITLIDALYDTRSVLICSAEVPVNQLFTTEEKYDT